jgi:hypothetical protein
MEKDRDRQRSVIGMFDVPVRPDVPQDRLSFAVPINKFKRMVNDMDESFLITPSWDRVRKRIKASNGYFSELAPSSISQGRLFSKQ